jgi:cysteinyl-tRNA synthetase
MDDGFRGLKLTNTMTRTKEEFRPLDWANAAIPEADKRVRMYVCGPTVYDFAHIGNARPVIVFDVLFRLLRHLYGAEHVTYVRNITDVDDKINARAARDFPGLPLNEAIRRVTETTAARFQKDATALGSLPPTEQPRATDFVGGRADGKPDMVSMISTLIKRGHAYEAAGEVLFDVTSMPDYGKLSNRKLEDQQAGARVAVDSHKKNPGDFVLWKLSDENEPGWESPWGRGRPGWHIECSVMSEAYLGATFDIHGGGLDLIFPHHENELAQSRCAHGTHEMAQLWMHNGFLQLEGKKMSKSDGNFITIAELLETETFGGRKWDGAVLRLAMMMTHYREPIDFSVKRLEEAEEALAAWSRAAEGVAASQPSQRFLDAWSDDLGGSAAIAELHALRKSDPAALRASVELIGLTLAGRVEATAEDPSIAARVAERLALLKAKDFAGADAIRAELQAEGIQLKDGKDASGERVTTWEVKR